MAYTVRPFIVSLSFSLVEKTYADACIIPARCSTPRTAKDVTSSRLSFLEKSFEASRLKSILGRNA